MTTLKRRVFCLPAWWHFSIRRARQPIFWIISHAKKSWLQVMLRLVSSQFVALITVVFRERWCYLPRQYTCDQVCRCFHEIDRNFLSDKDTQRRYHCYHPWWQALLWGIYPFLLFLRTSTPLKHWNLQVDPSKIEKGENVQQNMARLREITEKITNSIFASSESMPAYVRFLPWSYLWLKVSSIVCSPLREVFSSIRSTIAEQWPEDDTSRYTAVSGFVFLRTIASLIRERTLIF